MNLLVILAIIAAWIGLRFLKANSLAWAAGIWVGLYVGLSYGIDPPLPSSILSMFMAIITLALVTYLTAGDDRMKEMVDTIVTFVVAKRYTGALIGVLIALPLLVSFKVYLNMTQAPEPPISSRTIHPVPPNAITVNGSPFNIIEGHNPYRDLESSDAEAFSMHVENGRRVYYQNCVFCHGDNMEGDGLFAHGLDPIPANFQDPTTISMLQESYLYWRVAKGGPGLPSESTPWLSAMPAWENFLTEEEMWDVIIFLYDYTGQRPRVSEEVH